MNFFARLSTVAEDLAPAKMEWEEVDCPLCGSDAWNPFLEAPDPNQEEGLRFLVVQCQRCELCFTNPRPSPRFLGHYYRSDYGPHLKEPEENPGRVRWWKRWLPTPHNRSPRKDFPVFGEGRLLDIGCGGGSYLVRMRSRGWKVTGLEPSEPAVERMRRRFDLEVHQGTLPHPDLPEGSYDLITFWQSLEHVHWPLETLQAAHRLLAPQGRVLVALPNIQSLPFRWFGPLWHGLELPRHLTHFSPRTLRHMLQRAGFEPGKVRMVRSSSWLRQSVQLARKGSRPALWTSFLGTRLGSNLASWYCCLTRQSDSMMVTGLKKN